jgi:hypothetical protein
MYEVSLEAHSQVTEEITFAEETHVNSGNEHVTLLMSLHVAAKQKQKEMSPIESK